MPSTVHSTKAGIASFRNRGCNWIPTLRTARLTLSDFLAR
jgi:hypothetical protein